MIISAAEREGLALADLPAGGAILEYVSRRMTAKPPSCIELRDYAPRLAGGAKVSVWRAKGSSRTGGRP